MFWYLNLFAIEIDAKPKQKIGVKTLVVAEALFFLWAGLFAGLTFLVTVVLGILGILSLEYILYIYAGITVVTLLLAVLVYFVRGRQ